MKPLSKTIIMEIAILIIVFVVTWLAAFWVTGAKHILSPILDIGYGETVLVLSWPTVVIEPFLALVTVIYFIKEGKQGYKRKFQNFILIISNLIFLIQLTILFSIKGFLLEGAYLIIYPPLSALAQRSHVLLQVDKVFLYEHVKIFLTIIFMLILVISAIVTGKNWKSETHETKA